jgi:3-dehydroquinate synthase
MKSLIHSNLSSLPSLIQSKKIAIISDDNIWPIVKNRIEPVAPIAENCVFCIPSGENSKRLSMVETIASNMITQGFDRDTVILAIGGGVVTDLAGFLASIYQRGISYINIPTTLLAQVDAAIGGKTAVNLEIGKNQLGSFYSPLAVINDPIFLQTLPMRELRAGLAEVIKIAMIADAVFWDWLKNNAALVLLKDPEALNACVQKAAALKQNIVDEDFRDHGRRMLLNFGHTAAHVLETLTEYQTLLHGEAVAIGMLIELQYAQKMGLIQHNLYTELELLLTSVGLSTKWPLNANSDQIQKLLLADKKRNQSGLRMAVPIQIGEGKIFNIQDEAIFIQLFDGLNSHAN